MNKGLVSIIIPVYNRESLLSATIESVKNQTYSNWECLLIDDGSSDDSYNIALEYSKLDDRVRALKREREPKGAPTCRNIGMAESKGDFYMFLDSDDRLLDFCLERRVAFMNKNQNLDFSVWNTANDYGRGNLVPWGDLSIKDDLEGFLGINGWSVSATFFRREFKERVSWNEGAFTWQDWEFHIHVLTEEPNYRKVIDSEYDVYINRTHIERISRLTREGDRVRTLMDLFKGIEERLIDTGFESYLSFMKTPWFNFIQIAAVEFRPSEFQELLGRFESSRAFSRVHKKRAVMCYLKTQNVLGKFKLKPFQSVYFRLMKEYGRKHWL